MANRIAILVTLVFALAVHASAAIGIGPSDLYNQLVPQNPVRSWGKVTSSSPLRISDGAAEIEVTGLSDLDVGDFVWVEGDWNGTALASSQEPRKAKAYKLPSRTEMVYVPAGSFLMGTPDSYTGDHDSAEHPEHSVYLSGYWIGKYEVTRGEYRAFMNAGGYSNPAYWSSDGWSWKVGNGHTQPYYWAASQSWGTGTFTQTENHPVVGVTYYEAEAFCNWAGGHLATEAQWEKAARWTGSSPRVYPWGDTWDAEKCNNLYDHNPAGGGYARYQTAPVGSYPSGASPYGCHDMAGNVWEWCKDWYGSTYYSQTPSGGWSDPQGPTSGSGRVRRGGSWNDSDIYCRCAGRGGSNPSYDWNDLGFRLAR